MSTAVDTQEPIAVVGAGCRFPGGASSPSKLWDVLCKAPDLTRPPPHSRFNIDGFHNTNSEYHGSVAQPSSYFLEEDVSQFDNQFFSITPKEAEAMDPQQRLLLETVYEAMQNAGLTISNMEGSQTAVYVGLMCLDWTELQFRNMNYVPQYAGTGATRTIISNRVSYFYDWKGPSMTIDTACSSSLVAVHEAVRSLRTGECNMACAAGANLLLGPDIYVLLSQLHMASPTGRSRMWDAGANGYARGEGIAAVMLKRLSDAVRDGDHIEAVIRETGVNSDGRTKGITMPSNISQASLVRDTYRRAGLDVSNPADRPQYFEAHGTGTQAGDLQEATAISSSFFEEGEESPEQKLMVGSIKTVIGHTEGTAGLAGMMKAILAIQNGKVPPNLHLERLNPTLEKFMKYVSVPTVETEWPPLVPGVPRRASVNSFGYGGTNAHAILENFDPSIHLPLCRTKDLNIHDAIPFRTLSKLPLLFSASSETALLQTVRQYADLLHQNPKIDLQDLAWTLQSRRSALNFKISVSNTDRLEVIQQLEDLCKDSEGLGLRSRLVNGNDSPQILGVFTGQGAQWPTMGAKLMKHSWRFREAIEALEKSLAELPEPPKWSLKAELEAPSGKSRVGEAVISQPICTAIQIALVDLLLACGIKFRAVVGHSSGEIAAAYASGYLSAHDAIRVAYYRGFYAHLAKGKDGSRGAMMATGLSRAAAVEFCDQERFQDRLVMAASNSSTSVTLSGDMDAVKEAQKELSDTGTFARMLQVDTAYHSPHMQATAGPYVDALKACGITPLRPAHRGIWFSSAQSHHRDPPVDDLLGNYWRDNMVGAVLFAEALRNAAEVAGPFDFCLEVGPHPALKGPATQTLKDVSPDNGAYFGTLDRKKDDTVALADALAGLWMHTGGDTVNFDNYLSSMDHGNMKIQMLLDGPSYPWQHEQAFWRESRWSKRYRLRDAPHELLGNRIPSDSDQDMRWHQLLKSEEVPWLKDHRFMGQMVVPGAAYCAIALEAARSLADDSTIETIEISQLDLESAITLRENSIGVEVLSSLRPITGGTEKDILLAEFLCTAGPADGSLPFQKICSATVAVRTGSPSSSSLPTREPQRSSLNAFDLDRFYSMMAGIGLEYTGSFRGLKSAERSMHTVSATVGPPAEYNEDYLIHPSTLDVAIQTLYAAYSAPGDEAIWTSFLPRHIQKVTVNFSECQTSLRAKADMIIDTNVTDFKYPSSTRGSSIIGDIQIFNQLTGSMAIQVEGLDISSFDAGDEISGRQVLSYETWQPDLTEHLQIPLAAPVDEGRRTRTNKYHRVAKYYLQELLDQVPADQFSTPLSEMRNVASRWVETISRENPQWDSDTKTQINEINSEYGAFAEAQLLKVIGERLPLIARHGAMSLEDGQISDLISQLHARGFGSPKAHGIMSQLVTQISHKHASLKVLEVSPGAGDLTEQILQGLGGEFLEYFVPEGTPEVMEQLKVRYDKQGAKFRFQPLSFKQTVREQDSQSDSFDLIIVSTRSTDLETVISNARRMLRPGGYLLFDAPSDKNVRNFLVRIADSILNEMSQEGVEGQDMPDVSFGTLTPLQWDVLLRHSGFSGIDAIAHDFDDEAFRMSSVVLTQAVDANINYLRQPLKEARAVSILPKGLLIVGGKTFETFQFIESLCDLLGDSAGKITRIDSFAKLRPKMLRTSTSLLCLEDLDEPFIKSFTSNTWERMKAAVLNVSSVTWLLRGARQGNPFHAASLGLGRTIAAETPQTYFQFLDVDTLAKADAFVARSLLRLIYAESNKLKDDKTLLWKVEQELELEKGAVKIPRIRTLDEHSRRLNSFREVNTQALDIKKEGFHLVNSELGASLVPSTSSFAGKTWLQTQNLNLDVSMSSLRAVKLRNEAAFIAAASDPENHKRYLVALDQNACVSTISSQQAAALESQSSDSVCVQLAVAHIISQQILSVAPSAGVTIIQGPDETFASILSDLFTKANKKMVFVTRDTGIRTQSPGSDFVHIHPLASKRGILNMLPADSSMLIDLESLSAPNVTHNLKVVLLGKCIIKTVDDFLVDEATLTSPFTSFESLERQLHGVAQIINSKKPSSNALVQPWQISSISEVLGVTRRKSSLTLVNWSQDPSVFVKAVPINASTLFFPNKMYLLMGLTGELGLSICQWMVENGAKNIVLSSRSARVDPDWHQEMIRKGVNIRLERCDVTSKSQVMDLKARNHNQPFPIGGVFNGAMVMEDGPFSEMSAEATRKVLGPKADGTRFLDEAFHDDQLDFFVVLSSTTAVVGNPGQANYVAGNQFMSGVVASRRKRGLAATAVDFGPIIGVGFVRKSDHSESIERFLQRQLIGPISEANVHAILAEAILAGPSGENGVSELIAGLEKVDPANPAQQPSWLNNPRFIHHRIHTPKNAKTIDKTDGDNEDSTPSLDTAENEDEVSEILQRAFVAQLAVTLQAPPASIKPGLALVELGIDSLVAVEIRSWLLTFTGQDVSVLTILGGASVAEICKDIAPAILEASRVDDEDTEIDKNTDSTPDEPSAQPPIRSISMTKFSSQSSAWSAATASESTKTVKWSFDDDDDSNSDDDTENSTPATESPPQSPSAKVKGAHIQTTEPLSYGQSRIWFPSQFSEDPTTYNCTTSYRLRGRLDIDNLGKAIWSVTQRHESLRTAFRVDSSTGDGMQHILPLSPFNLEVIETANDSTDVDRACKQMAAHEFDLENGMTFAATVLIHSTEYATIVFGYHHIIVDGVSWQIILQDIEQHYSKPGSKFPPPSQYPAFAKKQRSLVRDGKLSKNREFWKSEFINLPEPLPLFPFAKVSTRKVVSRYDTTELMMVPVDTKLAAKVKKASLALKTTTFHLHLATVQVLLHRHLNVDDLCIGIVDANRIEKEHMQTVGFMLNMLPLRFKLHRDQPFAEVAKAARAKVYSALGNSAVPWEVILEDVQAPRLPGCPPLFQVMVNYRMGALKQKSLGNLALDFHDYADARNPYDIAIAIDETDDGSPGCISLSLPKYMFDDSGARLILDSYLNLLEVFADDSALSIDVPPIHSPPRANRSVDLGTGAKISIAQSATLSSRIRQVALESPESIAVKDNSGNSLSYDTLLRRSGNIFATIEHMVTRGSRVGVLCEPSADLVCSLLAIMRLGAVYVPLDSNIPDERLRLIAEEAQLSVIIHDDTTKNRAKEVRPAAEIRNVTLMSAGTVEDIPDHSSPDDNAFILFTSGSTGKPKGVQLTHANYLHHVLAATQFLNLDKEVILQQSSVGFDLSLAQIFYALANGGTVIMAGGLRDPEHLTGLMLRHQVTFTFCVPSEYSLMLDYNMDTLQQCTAWRVALSSGESFPLSLKEKFARLKRTDLRIVNGYGPTEASVNASMGDVSVLGDDSNNKVDIGKTLDNYSVYVVDESGAPMPIGSSGELVLGGPAISPGYLNNKDLTSQHFKKDMISPDNLRDEGWKYLYHTGDKAQILEDGRFVYEGRIEGDTQIKLNGIRVELEDIENTIVKHAAGAFTDAVVSIRGDTTQFPVAFAVFAPEKKNLDSVAFRKDFLSSLPLPSYMKPAQLEILKRMPLSPSGKLDRKALKAVDLVGYTEQTEPEDDSGNTVRKLKEIWIKLLQGTGQAIEINDDTDFFSVGGNSLLLLRLQAEIRTTFGKKLQLSELFKMTRLDTLSAHLGSAHAHVEAEKLDWDKETEISQQIIKAIEERSTAVSNANRITVALTGATGFLGQAILSSLLEDSRVEKVHCVAVRSRTTTHTPQASTLDHEKVQLHTGDLSQPNLGMSQQAIKSAFTNTHAIIHNGADVSFLKDYASLRAPNVTATKELIRLAPGVPFHFISTAGVALLSGQRSFREQTLASYQPPIDGSNGYVASKWASERILEKTAGASSRSGSVWIHRPSSITGKGVPSLDVVNNLMKHSRRMLAVPDLSGWGEGVIDLISVEHVASGIVQHVLKGGNVAPGASMTDKMHYVHHCGDDVVPLPQLAAFVGKTASGDGRPARVLPAKEWIKQAEAGGLHELVAAYIHKATSGEIDENHSPTYTRLLKA